MHEAKLLLVELDGDNDQEFIFYGDETYIAVDVKGNVLWRQSSRDDVASTAIAYDLNEDGKDEVLVAWEKGGFWGVDANGGILWKDHRLGSVEALGIGRYFDSENSRIFVHNELNRLDTFDFNGEWLDYIRMDYADEIVFVDGRGADESGKVYSAGMDFFAMLSESSFSPTTVVGEISKDEEFKWKAELEGKSDFGFLSVEDMEVSPSGRFIAIVGNSELMLVDAEAKSQIGMATIPEYMGATIQFIESEDEALLVVLSELGIKAYRITQQANE